MKRLTLLCTLTLLATTMAFAQSGTPSSKATAAYNSAVGCSMTATTRTRNCADVFRGAAKLVPAHNYVEAMRSTVKDSHSQSLFASASLVTGPYTNTLITPNPPKT